MTKNIATFVATAVLAVVALACADTVRAATIADSAGDFPAAGADAASKQGIAGWSYGYHNRTANGPYAASDFIPYPDNAGAGTSPTDYWTNSAWDWHAGNPPWDSITQTSVHPNIAGTEHWVTRRYTVEAADVPTPTDVEVSWLMDVVSAGSTGVTGIIFHNGTVVDSASDNPVIGGVSRTVRIPQVAAGDTIDVAHLSVGPTGDRSAGSDNTTFTATIDTVAPLASGTVIADSAAEFSGIQGTSNWQYGRHTDTLATGFSYSTGDFTPFAGGLTEPTAFSVTSAGVQEYDLATSKWDVPAGNPPWSEISAAGGHPNGTNNVTEEWVIRRWTSEVDGSVNVNLNLQADGGNGATARVFLNGVEQLSLVRNSTSPIDWTVHVPSISVGDVIDVALDPTGTDGIPTDAADSSAFGATVTYVAPIASVLVADSIADFPASGADSLPKQGTNNWTYGYHDELANGAFDAGDFIAFPDNEGGGTSATDFWNNSNWDWDNGNPPWDTINATGGHPNQDGTFDHWVIRRWEAEGDGDYVVESFFAKTNLAGGDGIIGRIFLNGVEQFSQPVAFNDGFGFTNATLVNNVHAGDFIDIVLDGNANSGNDSSLFSAQIFQIVPEPATGLIVGLLGLLLPGLSRRRRRA